MKKFKYLGVASTSDERQDEELDVRSGKTSVVMRALYHSVVLKRELSRKAKLSVFKSIFPHHHLWSSIWGLVTEKVRSQMHGSEMRFCEKSKVLRCLTNIATLQIVNLSTFETLLLQIERSRLRWFGHVSRMPQGRLPKQTLYAEVSGKRPVGSPRTRWLDYIEDLG